MRTAAANSLAVTALLAAPVALAHDGPHGEEEGGAFWLLLVVFSMAGSAAAVFGYRALYRAARARDAAAAEDEEE